MTSKSAVTEYEPGEDPGFHTVEIQPEGEIPARRLTDLHKSLLLATRPAIAHLLKLYAASVMSLREDPEGCDPAHLIGTIMGTLFVNVLHTGATAQVRLDMGHDMRTLLEALQAVVEEAMTKDEGGGAA